MRLVKAGCRLVQRVADDSRRFGVPADWIRAVMRAESRGEWRATSPKGAMGLMQIMPSTWTLLRSRFNLGADPYDPRDNILAGAGFLRELRDRYGSPGFLAAYNAGPGRYEEYLKAGRPLPAETWAYIETIAPSIDGGTVKDTFPATSAVLSWTQAPLFVSQDSRASTNDRAPPSLRPDHSSNDAHVVDISAFAPQANGLFVRVSAREPAP